MYRFLRDKSVFGRENAGTVVPVPPPGSVTSFNTRTGAVSLLSADITAALGYTPQVALGFTPVQQGGGAGQGTNKVYIGWSGTRLKAQVDSTDIGNIVFDGQLAGYWNSSNDGSGSGLDADLLDGLDSSYFASVALALDRVARSGDTMTGNLNFNSGYGITANGGIIRGQYVHATTQMATSAIYLDPGLDGAGIQGWWDVAGMRQYNPAMFALIGGTGPGYYWTTERPAFVARRLQAIAFLNDPTAATPTVYDVAIVGGDYFFQFKWYNNVSATWEDFGITLSPASGVTTPNAYIRSLLQIDPAAKISFGSQTRQMLDLWSTSYGIGVQNNTLYFRSAIQFNWFIGGVHNDSVDNPGAGGVLGMRLNSSASLSLATGVWHTSLSDNASRIFYSASSHTYIAAPGSVILRPGGGTTDYYDFGSGQLTIRWGSPTVWWRDSDARGFAIHVNSGVAYMMRGGTDDTTWTQITDAYGTARWMAEWDLATGQLTMAGVLYVANNAQVRDITATRGDGTGVIYLGNSTRYVYYDGTSYQMPTAGLTVGGLVKGRGGGRGMGQITLSTGNPSGGADGDIWLKY